MAGGSETILVVEDDDRVRLIAAEALRAQGYEILVAGNGEDALALAVARHEPIHLLLTDVVMPIMNGRQLSQAVTTIHPETTTLFTSGYTENIIASHGMLEEGLGKPYSLDSLVRRIRRLLDRKG